MYGNFSFPQIPYGNFPAGVDLGTCIVLPTGGNPFFVRSTGPADYDPPALTGRLSTTLSAALAQCRSGKYDTVYVLPGHSESVTDATMLSNLVAGTRIFGIGRGSNMPVFRWTNTAGSWAVNKADVEIAGLRLRLEGANGITKAINWTGADGLLSRCDVEVASGAALKATIALEVGTGADRMTIAGNVFRGTATHNVTDGVKVVAALDQVRICDNEMVFSATAANGLVHFTAAATNAKVMRNLMYNTHTASTACLVVDAVAADGVFSDNRYATVNNGTAASQGATFGAGSLIRNFECYSADEANKSGALAPAVVAT